MTIDMEYSPIQRVIGMADQPLPLEDPFLRLAVQEIESTYGDTVSVDQKAKSLLKFGRNDSLNTATYETVWMEGGHEVDATGNDIDSIVSSDGSDVQTINIEGHTLSGSDLTFVAQSATLTGQMGATLTTPLYRASRMYNTGTTDFAGTVRAYEDTALSGGEPIDTTKIHLTATGDKNQTEKAATSFESDTYAIITSMYVSVNLKTTGAVDFNFQMREFGKVWRSIFEISAHSQGNAGFHHFQPYRIIKPNTDVRVIAKASANGIECAAGFSAVLAVVT